MSYWNIQSSLEENYPSGIQNDKWTVRNGGNVDSNKFYADEVSLGVSRVITITSGVSDVSTIIPSNSFNTQGSTILRINQTEASNSVNNSFAFRQLRNTQGLYYKTSVRSGGWNIFSGKFNSDPQVGNTGAWSQYDDIDMSDYIYQSGVDQALKADPDFTYAYGSYIPAVDIEFPTNSIKDRFDNYIVDRQGYYIVTRV